MSQKIKAPNSKGGSGFLWGIVAILAIAAVVIGFLVVKNKGQSVDAESLPREDVSFEMTTEDNAVVLASKDVKKDAPKVEIFEDFSCPHCADLVEADHEDTLKALEDGDVIVKFRFLNFLDNGNVGSSTRGAATAWALAESGNVDAFWNMHNHMMLDQSTVARTWGWDELAAAAGELGASEGVVNSIKEGNDGAASQAGQEIAAANAKDLEGRAGRVSSPILYVDGEELPITSGPDGKPASWVPEVVKK
ncbi:MAG TPA: thioredoxin domain-containing protein [Candidatus Corynebacterium gallistercoris]|uniref:Thioredoxin domain-containing protein n=1 Tax=Candidatus Corynebacterium gallistercoris TaxID=2838530 RepID=A0A9D1RV81_9CORY|nr:thioredoxin domain-containing protein [Candidatus Corynebacterium gallistercoris]